MFDLSGLDECESFEHFIASAETTLHNNEGVGVLHQHHFSNEKMIKRNFEIKVRI